MVTGFGDTNPTYPGYLRVIDLAKEAEVTTIALASIDINSEPEFVHEYKGWLVIHNYGGYQLLKF